MFGFELTLTNNNMGSGRHKPPLNTTYMIKTIIIQAVTAIVVVALALAAFSTGSSKVAGGTFSTITQYFNDGIVVSGATSTFSSLKLGTNGSSGTFSKWGTCNLVGGAIAATSSASADCAVTGVLAGDIVIATLSTSSIGVITGAAASTTSGFITVRVFNLTGAASSVSALGTSTSYRVTR